MEQLSNLNTLFSAHLSLNMARVKALSMIVLALLEARNIRLSEMARYFTLSEAKVDSCFKRMQRFLRQVIFPADKLAMLILKILNIAADEKLTLVFDRTNWKFGTSHLNFLFLAFVYKGIAIPLFWCVLVEKKSGCSSFNERIKLTEVFLEVFGKEKISCILGDREFIGYKWIGWLRRNNLPYVMRLPESSTKIKHGGITKRASLFFAKMRIVTHKSIGLCTVGITNAYQSNISAYRNKSGVLVVLLHGNYVGDPVGLYAKRWEIENMFRAFKTSGFNLESTHVTHPERLSQLIGILAIAFCFAYKAGLIIASKKKTEEEAWLSSVQPCAAGLRCAV
jgi:hypothetical protein|tara:strand:+ start:40 stop:1050 length:1011 start_codon:yes stop_codon:yes gene_type:complete